MLKYDDPFTTGTIIIIMLLTSYYILYYWDHSKKKRIIYETYSSEIENRALRQQLIGARKALYELIKKQNCAPILLRLAWSDAATYDKHGKEWPRCGGTNGSIRTEMELSHESNAGLGKACAYLQTIKTLYPKVSWADLMQMGGVLAVEITGGPRIQIRYGRLDADVANSRYTKEMKSNKLPCPCYPFPDHAITPTVHVRNVFFRLGFTNKETVALMGGHTIGRAFKDRTGVCDYISGDQGATAYTRQNSIAKSDGTLGVGIAGGQSWTKLWLQFDNSYYKCREENVDPELLWLLTDDALVQCPEYRPYFIKFGANQEAFYLAYSAAHKKLSELGAKFNPPEGIYLE